MMAVCCCCLSLKLQVMRWARLSMQSMLCFRLPHLAGLRKCWMEEVVKMQKKKPWNLHVCTHNCGQKVEGFFPRVLHYKMSRFYDCSLD